jgi:hypothetical protein
MEFWLSNNNGLEKIQLPVNPPSFVISDGVNNIVIETIGIGEINIPGKGKLKEISIDSFFPARYAPYCRYRDILKPYDYISILQRWKQKQQPIRLIITETPINLPMLIENIVYGEEGGIRDIKYSLTLREYRYYTLKEINGVQTVTKVTNDTAKARMDKKAPGGAYTVKKGDSLWKIARQVYGSGSKVNIAKLKTNNKLKSDIINVGQRLIV